MTVDFGPKGTICNAQEPAPHMNCTTTPMETLTDAVRLAFEKAMPSKVAASWGHANGLNIAGWDTRTNEEFVTMVLATIIIRWWCNTAAGWLACGQARNAASGALTSGDVELLEYSYPIIIHKYALMTDSGGAPGNSVAARERPGKSSRSTRICCASALARGGASQPWVRPAPFSRNVESKVGRVETQEGRGKSKSSARISLRPSTPGETVTNMNPGRRRCGNPFERPIEQGRVGRQERPGFASKGKERLRRGDCRCAKRLEVDAAATERLRSSR